MNALAHCQAALRNARRACEPVNKHQDEEKTAQTPHKACLLVNNQQEAKDTAHTTQHIEGANR